MYNSRNTSSLFDRNSRNMCPNLSDATTPNWATFRIPFQQLKSYDDVLDSRPLQTYRERIYIFFSLCARFIPTRSIDGSNWNFRRLVKYKMGKKWTLSRYFSASGYETTTTTKKTVWVFGLVKISWQTWYLRHETVCDRYAMDKSIVGSSTSVFFRTR